MDLIGVTETITQRLDGQGVRYAFIGGFAMALRGVQRATVDLDFILMLEDLDKADKIFIQSGYQKGFKNENVSHYISDDVRLGRIDILHAFRGPTLSMLERAERIEVITGLSVPVVSNEDIIGLKVQASVNNPSRETADWFDIRMIIECCYQSNQTVDWALLEDYLDLFDLKHKISAIKKWYGTTDTDG